MAYDQDLLGFVAPVLLTFNINDASLTAPNVANVVGTIGIPFDSAGEDNVSGLSIDPLTGSLWALLKDADPFDNESEVDELWEISDPNNNPLNAVKRGDLTGAGGQVIQGEDLEFSESGVLFVSDDRSKLTASPGALWEIDLMRDASNDVIQVDDVTKVLDLNGITGVTDKFEAIGWDFENDRLVGSDDDADRFAILLGPGSVMDLGAIASGLDDVEGIDFVPEGEGPPPVVPEPASLLLVFSALLSLAARKGTSRR